MTKELATDLCHHNPWNAMIAVMAFFFFGKPQDMGLPPQIIPDRALGCKGINEHLKL